MRTRSGSRTTWWAAGLAGAALLVASCADDTSSAGSDASPGPTAEPAVTDVTDAAATADSSPVTGSAATASTVTEATGSASTGSATCRPGEPADLVVWHSFGGDVAVDEFDRLVAEYGRVHGVTVRAEKVGGYIELIARLAESDLSDWPDIVVGPTTATRTLLDSQRFVVPGACGETTRFTDAMLPVIDATYRVDGELVAVPYGVSAPVLIFDRAEFRAAGLDPDDPPATLDELVEASAAIVASGASPYGLVLDDHVLHWIVQHYAARRGELLIEPDNGRTGQVALDLVSDEVLADVATVRAGIEAGHVRWLGPNVSSFDDLVALVAPEQAGTMTIHTSGSIGDVIANIETGSFPGVELGVAPLPGPGVGSAVGGNALWLVDSGDPSRVGAAWDLASWLFDAPQLARFVVATGYVPATTDAAADPVAAARWAQYPQLRVAFDQLAAMPGTDASGGLVIGPADELADELYRAASSVFADGVDPTEALHEVERSIDELARRYPNV